MHFRGKIVDDSGAIILPNVSGEIESRTDAHGIETTAGTFQEPPESKLRCGEYRLVLKDERSAEIRVLRIRNGTAYFKVNRGFQ